MESDAQKQCDTFEFFICGVAIGIVCLFGISGNITSFLVLWKHKVQTATILLFQCLAFVDTVLLVMSLFVYTLPVIGGYTELIGITEDYHYVIMYIWPFGMMAHTVTVWLTVVVTLHRFFCVCKPHGLYVRYNDKIIRITILAVISLSCVFNIPRFFEHYPFETYEMNINETNGMNNASANGTRNNITTRNLGENFFYQLIYSNIIYFPVMYIVPLITLIFLSYRLTRAVRGLEQRRTEIVARQAPTDHITLCIIVIVIVFVLCQTPALINQIFWTVLAQTERDCGKFHFYYTKVCDLLVIINSSVNFIIFCLFGNSFRKIFIDALCENRCIAFIKGYRIINTCNKTIDGNENVVPLQML